MFGGVVVESFQEGIDLTSVELFVAPLNPLPSPWSVRTVDDLPDGAEMLLGMEAVEDLNGLREQFGGGIPNPSRPITSCGATCCLGKTSARGFP